MPGQPTTIEEYLQAHGEEMSFPPELKYQMNINLIDKAVSGSKFIGGIEEQLVKAAGLYSTNPLLLFPFRPQAPEILTKPYASTINKCFRLNCLHNRDYPRAPKDGWITGAHLYSEIPDILRCRVVCRYLDGPEFLCRHLEAYAKSLGLETKYYSMANDRGYYAWHFYVRLPVNVIVEKDVEETLATLEIQFTTQLAEVLTALTHQLYENERVAPAAKHRHDGWKWAPDEMRFKTAYMGHTLHMLEGIILNIKNEVAPKMDAAKEAEA